MKSLSALTWTSPLSELNVFVIMCIFGLHIIINTNGRWINGGNNQQIDPEWEEAVLIDVSFSVRRIRGEAKKCRKVYGIEHRDQWCTACRWKKACQRFLDWTEEDGEEEEEQQGLRQAALFGLAWWMFYTLWNQTYSFVFILFLHFLEVSFFIWTSFEGVL